MATLECTTQRDGEHAVIAVTGELDISTRDMLIGAVQAALGAGATSVEIDLSGLRFCDSSGLTALVAAYRIAEADNCRAYVGGASAPVRYLLDAGGYQRLHRRPPPNHHLESSA
jgi:anti-sigma B factor antagonist